MRTTMAVGLMCLGAAVSVGDADEPRDRAPLSVAALSADRGASERACDALRARGPAGLEALLDAAAPVLARGPADAQWRRATRAIDRVAAQHDAWASRLYWYTDLATARAEARASGRPILALRLLGRLDEPLSCANSRFFRIALYPDPKVAGVLRDRFVLYWESERAAPKITIDYGDGRVLERTITGNSLHEVLDADGRLVDVIPGMWGPAGFRDELLRALALEASLRGLAPDARRGALARAHRERLDQLAAEWPESRGLLLERAFVPSGLPRARDAAQLAVMKSVSQMTLLETADPGFRDARVSEERLRSAPRDIAIEVESDARLSPESVALLRLKEGPGSDAPGAGAAGPEGERRFENRLARFENAIARDELQNRYVLGREIHARLAQDGGRTADDRDAFNGWVYAEVFLTPRSDPWLGLAPEDAFTGIERGGVTTVR